MIDRRSTDDARTDSSNSDDNDDDTEVRESP